MQDLFEKTLFENPDDLATYSAYADWLLEQNDPRGELMQIQLRIEQSTDEAERKSLRKRVRELQSTHESKWLGGLAKLLLGRGSEEFNYSFSRGFLGTLTLRELRLTTGETLARSPAVRLLRDLTIRSIPREPPPRKLRPGLPLHDPHFGLYPLAESPHLRNLRRLQLGEIPRDWNSELKAAFISTDPDPLFRLIDRNPGLEILSLHLPSLSWPSFATSRSTPRLRELTLCGGSHHGLETLCRNPSLSQLESLTLIQRPIQRVRDSTLQSGLIQELLLSPCFPRLTSLKLTRFLSGDEVCNDMARSGRLKSLRRLSLICGEITSDGVDALLSCPELSQLQVVDLSTNRISATQQDEIRRRIPHAILEDQFADRMYAAETAGNDNDEDLYDDNWE